jgi:hypothetical protein
MTLLLVEAGAGLLAMTAADWEFLRGAGGASDAGPGLSGSAIWATALAGAGALLLAWIVVAMIRRDRARHGPAVRLIARGLGLSGAQRRLIRHVARVTGVREVGSLLISRGCYDRAVQRYVGRHGRAAPLAAIRRAMFDS